MGNKTQAAETGEVETLLIDVQLLKEKYQLTDTVFAGLCSFCNWNSGKRVSEAEFIQSISTFRHAPIDARGK